MSANENHFLDEVPYPLGRPEARELRNLLATSMYGASEILEVLRATGIPPEAVYLDKPARFVWSDLLVQASQRNPNGGARAFVEQLAAAAAGLGADFLKARLEPYLGPAPPPTTATPALAPPPSTTQLEKVLGMRSAFVDPVTLPAVIAAARSVVRIAASFDVGPKYGTGFLIAAGRVLTNHHVLYENGKAASALEVWLDYESDAAGAVPAPVVVGAEVGSIRGVKADDVGVFDLSAALDRAKLELSEQPAQVEAKVAIVQHPMGMPKQIAFHTVVDVKDGLVRYLTDTEPGSSGSPVLNRRGQVVALHHASTDVRLKGGQVPVNEGIGAERIRLALKSLEP